MSRFWKIEENVGRYYIVLPETYETYLGAVHDIVLRHGANQCMRPAQYETGEWNGPRRVKDSIMDWEGPL